MAKLFKDGKNLTGALAILDDLDVGDASTHPEYSRGAIEVVADLFAAPDCAAELKTVIGDLFGLDL